MAALLRLEAALFMKDRALQLALVVLAALLVATVFTGAISEEEQRTAFLQASERIHFEWQNQPPRNPHGAAHHGLFVYRGQAPLSSIESGVLSHQGAALFLEAHKRNQPYLSPAALRLTPAGLSTDKLLPLLHIAGGLAALVIGLLLGSRDQRRRTLPMLASVDSRQGRLVAQTIFVVSLVVVGGSVAILLSFFEVGPGAASFRLILTTGLSILHLGVLAACGVVGGAAMGSRPGGIAVIALLWGLGAIAAPRLLGLIAESLIPTTQIGYETQLEADLETVMNAHGESDLNEVFKNRVLKEYGVDSVDDLPVNFDALLMQEEEYQRAPVYEARLGELARRARAQDAIRALSWLLSPTPAMLEVSARLSGAHFEAQLAFDRAAEAYRLEVVEELNQHMAEHSRTGDWDWIPDDDYYGSFKPFSPPAPDLWADIRAAAIPASAIVLWLLAAVVALNFASRRPGWVR
ncbi:MAG: DUF3526 domain-containing protein [Pseudomonadota bacterium]